MELGREERRGVEWGVQHCVPSRQHTLKKRSNWLKKFTGETANALTLSLSLIVRRIRSKNLASQWHIYWWMLVHFAMQWVQVRRKTNKNQIKWQFASKSDKACVIDEVFKQLFVSSGIYSLGPNGGMIRNRAVTKYRIFSVGSKAAPLAARDLRRSSVPLNWLAQRPGSDASYSKFPLSLSLSLSLPLPKKLLYQARKASPLRLCIPDF